MGPIYYLCNDWTEGDSGPQILPGCLCQKRHSNQFCLGHFALCLCCASNPNWTTIVLQVRWAWHSFPDLYGYSGLATNSIQLDLFLCI